MGCGRFRSPPAFACRSCQSFECHWVEAFGPARLFSYTVVHISAHPGLSGNLPYIVGVVRFADMGDVGLVSNIVDLTPDALRIDMELSLVWQEAAEGFLIPRFASLQDPGAAPGD
jgi:uncharacterized OB-fold protein